MLGLPLGKTSIQKIVFFLFFLISLQNHTCNVVHTFWYFLTNAIPMNTHNICRNKKNSNIFYVCLFGLKLTSLQ